MKREEKIDSVSSATLELGFTGLELLTHSYLNALKIVTEHKGREAASLRDVGGTRIQVAREGMDNIKRYYDIVKDKLPANDYSNVRALADKMYVELSEIVVENTS